MHMLLAFMFLTNFHLHLCYEFECPNTSHWHFRTTAVCNSSELYGCLYDKINNKYAERCLWSPSVERIGVKNVFSGGIDRVPCEDNRFQPFPFSTNGNDECVYAKSICSLEGQVVSQDFGSDIDRSCRCDYTYGYAFVLEPAKKCKCDPFIEDCTCYKKQCSLNSVLSPDYHCITVNNWKGSITCPLLDATSTKKGDKHPGMPKVFLENDNKGLRNVLPRVMLTLSIILFVSSIAVVAFTYQMSTKSYLNTDILRKTSVAVQSSEVDLKSSINLIEEEKFDCTEEVDNMSTHSKDKPFAHLHLNHSYSKLKELMRLSADIRQRLLPITVPAFDLYLYIS